MAYTNPGKEITVRQFPQRLKIIKLENSFLTEQMPLKEIL